MCKGKKLKISYFGVSGCKCFIHNNDKENLGKFILRSNEGIFVSYFHCNKASREYNEKSKVIKESIYVIFDENNNGIVSLSSFQNWALSRYNDGEEVKANFNKASAQSSVESTLNQLENALRNPKTKNSKDSEVRPNNIIDLQES